MPHAFDDPALVASFAMFAGVFAQVIARHVRVPGIVLLLLAGVASSPSVPAADDRTEAAALFAEAGRLIDAGQTSAACAKYEESLRLYDGINTRYFLADCDERVGKTATAWSLFLEVEAKARALEIGRAHV